MSDLKRYDLPYKGLRAMIRQAETGERARLPLLPTPDGDWVLYEDAERLLAEIERLNHFLKLRDAEVQWRRESAVNMKY